MLRTILSVAVALFICADVAVAKGGKGGKKASGPVIGTIKSVDAAAGTVTVTVTSKKGSKDTTFTVADTTAVAVTNADGTSKDLKGKDGLKDSVVKEGATIKVTSDATGAVTDIAVGGSYSTPHKKKNK
jgi:hypothetical protein